ncbi:Oxidoreductase-like domain-containing protein 1 [Mizuhopecten yessoensis]|uniref:Oxidoreductase-like domain-containing protein 1 n=1 Tax=Mizuhopecten yessoensis TaxID=6573 RepID=A0A210QL36_MIZYE|nr:Oxidoreductase-like domain-containing protein 1 [Mizuhopecten yessoensis]
MNLQGLKNPSGRALHCFLKHHWPARLLGTPNVSTAVHACHKTPVTLTFEGSNTSATQSQNNPGVLNMSSFCGCLGRGQRYSTSVGSNSDEDPILKIATISDTKMSTFTEIVPGKGPPPEPPVECCMSGCANCVWIKYAEELKEYYGNGIERALKEIELIDNPSLKAFIKLELSLL